MHKNAISWNFDKVTLPRLDYDYSIIVIISFYFRFLLSNKYLFPTFRLIIKTYWNNPFNWIVFNIGLNIETFRRYSSFNKRSEPEGEDPWSCVVSVSDRGGSQRPRSSESRKEPTNHRGSSELGAAQRTESRQPGRDEATPGQRQESSRQTSEDISWEFTINEAPIARLESLDELDQDHVS